MLEVSVSSSKSAPAHFISIAFFAQEGGAICRLNYSSVNDGTIRARYDVTVEADMVSDSFDKLLYWEEKQQETKKRAIKHKNHRKTNHAKRSREIAV